ncbi:MAG TPA: MFS transporter [Solirubrobacterales bacterium]|nr:MFS transporter [Solirubrobacterales bacterium]
MRKLLVIASAMVFLEVAFYSAIAPLLPDYVDKLDLGKTAAGILSSAYAAGTLVGALPAGWIASRIGPRRSVIAGLLLLGCASLVFGLVNDIVLLDAARFVQGFAGSLIWSGALVWLITSTPEENRGRVIGTALGTAVAGALLGPALGALAASIGTDVVFGSVLVIAIGFSLVAARLPESGTPDTQPLREVLDVLRSRPIVDASIFVVMPSLMFGAIEVLIPLRIDALGGGHGLIAAGFIAGAGIEAGLAPAAGRISDRSGRRLPYAIGVAVCGAAMVVLALAMSLGVVVTALLLSSIGAGFCFAPAMTLVSDVAEESRLHQGFAAGVSNMAWASGQVLGGIASGAVASATGFGVPSIGVAVLMLLTVFYAYRVLEPDPGKPQVEG